MSGPPRVRSMNVAGAESRPVLVPACNKARTIDSRKPASKAVKKAEKLVQETESKEKNPMANSIPQFVSVPEIRRQQEHHQALLNMSMNASCSSDASSTDSSTHSRASSSGKVARRVGAPLRKKQSVSKAMNAEKASEDTVPHPESTLADTIPRLDSKKRCAWVTANTDPCYAAFHDEEWGVPVHDDKKLFELLCLSSALAELTWPAILSKRQMFREVFLDFDPIAVSQLNEKRLVMPGSPASSLLSELRLRAIIENAHQTLKVMNEFGSLDAYVWNFVNHKPIVGQFRYARQVPVKTSKAEVISKDLMRRGFRSVGPTVVYTFMQVAGLTNDHLVSCFRFNECIARAETKVNNLNSMVEEKPSEKTTNMDLSLAMDGLSLNSN